MAKRLFRNPNDGRDACVLGPGSRPGTLRVLRQDGTTIEIPEERARGDCYQLSGEFVAGLSRPIPPGAERGLWLVHGTVSGQGALAGVRFGHAWIEYGIDGPDWTAYDPTTDVRLPAGAYRAIGQALDVVRYTPDLVRRFAVRFGHWGPWTLPDLDERQAGDEALFDAVFDAMKRDLPERIVDLAEVAFRERERPGERAFENEYLCRPYCPPRRRRGE